MDGITPRPGKTVDIHHWSSYTSQRHAAMIEMFIWKMFLLSYSVFVFSFFLFFVFGAAR